MIILVCLLLCSVVAQTGARQDLAPSYSPVVRPASDVTSRAGHIIKTPSTVLEEGTVDLQAAGSTASVEGAGGNGTLSAGMSLSQVCLD